MDIKELVLNTLKEATMPMKSGEISEKVSVDKKEIDKAIKALKEEEKIDSPKRCYYSIKE